MGLKVVVTGAAGKLGSLVCRHLVHAGHEVIGLDPRRGVIVPAGVEIIADDIRKRTAEEVFRSRKPDAVIHMATMAEGRVSRDERERINLQGTRALFDHCHNYGVKSLGFIGRHTFYGAAADAPLYRKVDDPPRAIHRYPELADLVAADLYAGSALWRYPEIHTSVLRICYTLGPMKHGTLAHYLKGPKVPMALGFDPLFEIIHEDDVVAAICLALEKQIRGVFNVTGPPPLPLSALIEEAGREVVALPAGILRRVQGRFGLPRLARGAIAHLQHPVIIDGKRFVEATGFEYAFDDEVAIRAFATGTGTGHPAPRR